MSAYATDTATKTAIDSAVAAAGRALSYNPVATADVNAVAQALKSNDAVWSHFSGMDATTGQALLVMILETYWQGH